MNSRDKKISELEKENQELKRQLEKLMDKYARMELEEMEHSVYFANLRRLNDFMQRITLRFDDDDLLDVMVEEFMIELKADRVSYILPGNGPTRTLAVSQEAVEKGLKRLPLPYFLSSDDNNPYIRVLYRCLDRKDIVLAEWNSPIPIVPSGDFQLGEQFQALLAEEFDLTNQVDCQSVMACPLENRVGGSSIISVQRTGTRRPWSKQQQALFKEMCRYAGTLMEHSQLAEQVRDLKDQLSSLVESMPSAIVGMDLLGTVTMWNGRAVEFFDIPEDRALGNVFWEIVPQYAFVTHAMKDLLQKDQGSGIEFEPQPFKTRDGRLVYFKPHLFSMFRSNRGEVALRVDDVTRTVELNHQLFHSQRMETVGTLAGGLAHDFNNVLGGIVGTISLMKQKVGLLEKEGKEFNEDLEVIESCTNRASEMVKRLLSLAKKNESEQEPVEINGLVLNVIRLCQASFDSRIQIKTKYAAEELWMMGDRTQLEQAILNLSVNARDAMKSGGTLSIHIKSWKVTDTFRIRHGNVVSENMARIVIRDTGEGIPLENLDRIFDPFFTTKSEHGTGLGLSIVDKIIKQHSGYLEVDSGKNIGTSFTLFLPLSLPTSPKGKLSAKGEYRGEGEILVVDDDQIMRKIAGRILDGLGYTVTTVPDGASAIRLYENSRKFDLIIMDVDMPGINGLDTARIIRRSDSSQRILFCTSRQHQYEMTDFLSEPNSWLIEKPFDLEKLAAKVKIGIQSDSTSGSQRG